MTTERRQERREGEGHEEDEKNNGQGNSANDTKHQPEGPRHSYRRPARESSAIAAGSSCLRRHKTQGKKQAFAGGWSEMGALPVAARSDEEKRTGLHHSEGLLQFVRVLFVCLVFRSPSLLLFHCAFP